MPIMQLSSVFFLLFIGLVTFCCAHPIRSLDENQNDDEDITGVEPSPVIPRGSSNRELDIDKEVGNDDDDYSLRRRQSRRVIGVAPPAVLQPIEDKEVKIEDENRNERRRRELKENREVIVGGTPPPFLPSPADDEFNPAWLRLRRQTNAKDDSGESSDNDNNEDDDGAYRRPRQIEQQRRKRFRKSLRHQTARCVGGRCSEDNSEMSFFEPEDDSDKPLVRIHRDLESNSEEDTMAEDSSKQIDADDEGALRLPRRADEEMSASMPVEEEEGGAHIEPGLGPVDDEEYDEGRGKDGLLKRRRRHNNHHHRHPQFQKQKRNMEEPRDAASPCKTGEDCW